MSDGDEFELLPPGDRGEVLTNGDLEALARVLDEELRGAAKGMVLWYRRNLDKYAAAVAATRRIVARSGPGVAPLHMAFEMRHPPRGIAPVEVDNGMAVFLARVAAKREPDLRNAFDFRRAASADAVLAAGWDGGFDE